MANGLREFLMGTPQRTEQIARYNPQQQQAFGQVLQQALSGMQNPTQGFAPIAQQARGQFQRETIPSIMERFSGLDAQRSSGFQQALGQAGAGLEESLAGMGAQYGLQQQGLMQNLLGLGLQPQFEPLVQQRQPGFLESLGVPLAQGAGGALGMGALGGFGGTSLGLIDLLKNLLGNRSQQSQQPMGSFAPTQPTAQYQPYTSPSYQNLQFLQPQQQQPTYQGQSYRNLQLLSGGY